MQTFCHVDRGGCPHASGIWLSHTSRVPPWYYYTTSMFGWLTLFLLKAPLVHIMWCCAPLNAVLGQNLSEKPINGITPRSGFREKDKDGYSFSSETWVPHYSKIRFFLFCYFIMTPTFGRTRYTKFRAGSSNEKPRLFGLNILKRVLKWRFLHVFATRLHAAELFFANAGLSR